MKDSGIGKAGRYVRVDGIVMVGGYWRLAEFGGQIPE
jgi:hypothetical protein